MIIFALLDSKLIRFQKDEDRSKRNNLRPSGQKAAKNIEKRYDSEEEKNLYRLFEAANIFGCIDKFFEPGNDFKCQPKLLIEIFWNMACLLNKLEEWIVFSYFCCIIILWSCLNGLKNSFIALNKM